MDILAHSLWAAAAAATARRNVRVSIWRTAWWGIFPDIVSLGPIALFDGLAALENDSGFWQEFLETHYEPATSL